MPTFVVERFNWRRVARTAWLRLPGENAVATFDTADEAHASACRLDAAARTAVGHPFRCGTALLEVSTLPEFAFLDWLQDVGIEPPDPDPDGRLPWLAWADLYRGEWSAGQLVHLWEGCNRVRFHFIRERAADPLHCVVRVHWSQDMNGTNYLPESEGGTPVAVWHDRERAEADGREKQRLAAEEVAAAHDAIGDAELLLEPMRRVAMADPFADVPAVPPVPAATHCQVFEIERGEPDLGLLVEPLGERAFVVVRLGWDSFADEDGTGIRFSRDRESGGVPDRVFADRPTAERWCWEREAAYRQVANPFRFLSDDFAGVRMMTPALLAASRSLGNPLWAFDPRSVGAVGSHWSIPLTEWWGRGAPQLTVEQFARAWEHLAGLRFHEVREVRVADAPTRLDTPRASRTLYYVRATNWIPDGGPNVNPHRFLGAFADPARAEAVRDEADRQARTNRTLLPMVRDYDPDAKRWELFSSWGVGEMRRHFVRHGLITETEAIACGGFEPNSYWWDDIRERLRPEQAAAFWHVMDRVRLYEVRQLETEVAS